MLAMRDAEMRQVMRTAMSYDGYVVAEARHDLELLVALVEMGQGLIPTPDLLVWDVALAPAEALTLVRRLHERGMALVLVPGQEAQRMWAEAAGERVRFCEGANAVVTYGAVCDLVPAPALSAASA
jgi:CheY-like chemotaxis protein